MSEGGVMRLALQVCMISLLGNIVLVGFIIRWLPRVCTQLDRLASRPCLATQETIEEFIRRGGGK